MPNKYKFNGRSFVPFQEAKIQILFSKYGISLPLDYKEFILNYKVGRNIEKWDAYLDRFIRPTPVYKISIQTSTGLLNYNWLSSISQILHDLKYYPDAASILDSSQLLRIGDVVERGGIFLGVGEINKGKIYRYLYDTDEAPVLLFASIYDFVNSINLELNEGDLDVEMSNNKRYVINNSVVFEKTRYLEDVEISDSYNGELLSSDFLLDILIKEVDNV